MEPVDRILYEIYEVIARGRIAPRDVEDWPVVAASLLMACPIGMENQDFFGSGVATWTTNKIEPYLRDTYAAHKTSDCEIIFRKGSNFGARVSGIQDEKSPRPPGRKVGSGAHEPIIRRCIAAPPSETDQPEPIDW